MKTIYLKDYTVFPSGPTVNDGPTNAETFRLDWIQPALIQGNVLLDLTGTLGLAYNYMSQIVNFPDEFQVISGTIDPDNRNIYTYKYIYQNHIRTLRVVNELSSYSFGLHTLFKERIEQSYRIIDFAKEYTSLPSTHKASYDVGKNFSSPRDAETFKNSILIPALHDGHVFLNMSRVDICMMVYYREILNIPNARPYLIFRGENNHTIVYKINNTLRALIIHSDLEFEMILWKQALSKITLECDDLECNLALDPPVDPIVKSEQHLGAKDIFYGLWVRLYLGFLCIFQKG